MQPTPSLPCRGNIDMLDLRPRRDFKAELDLTPFMDVIFILLLFFIIA